MDRLFTCSPNCEYSKYSCLLTQFLGEETSLGDPDDRIADFKPVEWWNGEEEEEEENKKKCRSRRG
jgi:hypothetical protein